VLPVHVFLSYARADVEIAERLRQALEQNHVPVWIDRHNLTVGTPSWERAIRTAIEQSYAVVLLVSPRTRDSDAVQAEVTLARASSVPIIPAWVDGESWAHTAPFMVAQGQYVDLRGSEFEARTNDFVTEVCSAVAARRPKHALVPDPFGGWYDHSVPYLGSGIRSYVSVPLDLPPFDKPRDQRLRDEKIAVFDPTCYTSLHMFLDDLYMNYLSERFEAVSYGCAWVLKEDPRSQNGIHPERLLVPWSWLVQDTPRRVAEIEPFWGRSSLPGNGIAEGAVWKVVTPHALDTFGDSVFQSRYGIAVQDDALYREIREGPGKQPLQPYYARFLERVAFARIRPARYKYLGVVIDNWSGNPFAGHVLRQSRRRFDPTHDRRAR
jgi:TIR domain-containing protein